MSAASSSKSSGEPLCPCTEDSTSVESPLTPHCVCPRGRHDIVIHEETCLLYKNETFPDDEKCQCDTSPDEPGICDCCACPVDQCCCDTEPGRQAYDQWRNQRAMITGAMPAVLESSHPLMEKFQDTLRKFLEKENALAEEEIINLREQLKESKEAYNEDLEELYRNDHDTNAQRTMIQEYEANLAKMTAERAEADKRAREANERYKKTKERLEKDMITEREATEEFEALTNLVRQLEQWREETESELTVSHHMSDNMKKEKKTRAAEKRQLDMIIFGLSNEIWKLESKLEMYQKQLEIKNNEMDNVNDRVTSYAAELEDLDLEQRRLMSLWNSVLVNIRQRDKVYDDVRDDYKVLQDNYRTLLSNLEITKKSLVEEMNRSKEISMTKDKLLYEIASSSKLYDTEDAKRVQLETQIGELAESIEMCERDQDMIKMENQTMMNILKGTTKELDRKNEQKTKLENEILTNLQEILLNDKAVESMANGIKKMREMSRKQEISLMAMESTHAKVMLDIEVSKSREIKNKILLEDNMAKVTAKEKELQELEEKYEQKNFVFIKKQRDLDTINKKYAALKEVFDAKSPQQRRMEELEQQIVSLRSRTEQLQGEWLRLQGHVVKLATQHQKLTRDVALINKQIQICDQKTMRLQMENENVEAERARVDRSLRDLRGRMEVLEHTRKTTKDKNNTMHRSTLAVAHEYAANLKGAESEILQLEEEIENHETEKTNMTQELDRVQRESLIWQRKCIVALDLKKNITDAKSAAGEIGQMKSEIHRMEVRRDQLRRIAEKLSEDLAHCIRRREIAIEKSRATAAVEKHRGSQGQTSHSTYHHKLRLARADVARVTKDIQDTQARSEELKREQERLEREVTQTNELNAQLEERVATLLRECRDAEREKQWLIERVVRSQRLGNELANAVKRKSLKVKKPKNTLIQEYTQSRALNDRIRTIVTTLAAEYPYLEDRLSTVVNTLSIDSGSESPRLVEDCACDTEQSINVAEKPFCDCDDE